MRHRRACLLAALLAAPLPGVAQTIDVAVSGQAAPDGNGTFDDFLDPVLNERGEVAFGAASMDGTLGGFTDDNAILLADGSTLTLIAREGAPAPGGGVFATFSRFYALSEAPFVGFTSGVSGTNAHFTGDGTSAALVARTGDPVPNGTLAFGGLTRPLLNAAGQLGFHAFLTPLGGGGVVGRGLYLHDGSGLRELVRAGDPSPDGNGQFAAFNEPSLASSGSVAVGCSFAGTAGGTTDDLGLLRIDDDGPVIVAREPQATPDGGASFVGFPSPLVNGAGQAALLATAIPTGGGVTSGIYVADDAGVIEVARQGQPPPDGNGVFAPFSEHALALNEAGQVAFGHRLTGTSGGSADDWGLFRFDAPSLQQILRKGDTAPEGRTFEAFENVGLAGGGQIAFLSWTTSGASSRPEIFLTDAQQQVRVASRGDPVAGSTTQDLELVHYQSGADGPDRGGRSGLNDLGQVTYRALLANGSQAIRLFTPRAAGDGVWDDAENFTLGLSPASVHRVEIEPTTALTVVGPASDVTVRALSLDSEAPDQVAELVLGAGVLETLEGLTIGSGGRLLGDGAVSAEVASAGSVAPGDGIGTLEVLGDYAQTGTLEIEIGGLGPGAGHDQLVVAGHASLGGRLEVVLVGGFAPVLGDAFPLVSAASRSGVFAQLSLPPAPAGSHWKLSYAATGVTLRLRPPGCGLLGAEPLAVLFAMRLRRKRSG